MRNFVPMFALILSAFTGAPSYGADVANTLEEYKAITGCQAPTDPVKVQICQEGVAAFCNGRGRDSCSNPGIPPITVSGITDAASFEAAAGRAKTACENQKATADDCCNNPKMCGLPASLGGGSTEGLETKQICERYAADTKFGQAMNSKVAGTCRARKEVCRFKCDSAVVALKDLVDAHGKRYSDSSNAFKAIQNTLAACDRLSEDQAAAQAQQMFSDNSIGEMCKGLVAGPNNPSDPGSPGGPGGGGGAGGGGDQAGGNGDELVDPNNPGMGGMNPMALMQMAGPLLQQLMQGQEKPAVNLDPIDCSVNPNLAGCLPGGQAPKESWNAQGETGTTTQSTDSGGFNVADTGDSFAPQAALPTGVVGTPATNAGVPNGGGGIPQGGGSASLGGGGGGGGGGASLAPKVELGAERGGPGGGTMGALNEKLQPGVDGGGGGGGSFSMGGLEDHLNLSDYLPGGKQDPTRRLPAGMQVQSANAQINAPTVNLWNRVSDRIRARCAQGLLRDCVP